MNSHLYNIPSEKKITKDNFILFQKQVWEGKFPSKKEYRNKVESSSLPDNFPKIPETPLKKLGLWDHYFQFLGMKFCSYPAFVQLVSSFEIKTQKQWEKFLKKNPIYLEYTPRYPTVFYDEINSWKGVKHLPFKSYTEARRQIFCTGGFSKESYLNFRLDPVKLNVHFRDRTECLPAYPEKVYEEFTTWEEFTTQPYIPYVELFVYFYKNAKARTSIYDIPENFPKNYPTYLRKRRRSRHNNWNLEEGVDFFQYRLGHKVDYQDLLLYFEIETPEEYTYLYNSGLIPHMVENPEDIPDWKGWADILGYPDLGDLLTTYVFDWIYQYCETEEDYYNFAQGYPLIPLFPYKIYPVLIEDKAKKGEGFFQRYFKRKREDPSWS